jgi:hypothetical protein
MTLDHQEKTMGLIDCVKNILLTPKTEWPVIDREPGDVPYIFTNYVAILAAIPAISGFIGMLVVGSSSPGSVNMRVPVATGLLIMIVNYLLTFAIVYVVALIVDALAPTFSGRKNFESALKATAYSFTPIWIAGIFLAMLGFLSSRASSKAPRDLWSLSFVDVLAGLVVLYGIYLLWTGLPILMKSPQDKALPYTVAIVVCAIIIQIILSLLLGAIFANPRMM